MCTMLNIHYQLPISILTLLNLKFKQRQLKRSLKKEPFNFNLVEPSEVKHLAFVDSLC